MTTAAPHRTSDPQASTEAHEPVGVLGHSARRDSLSFERPAPGRYLAVDDGDVRRLIPLRGSVTHLGRGFSADVRLDDQSVSRRHAVLVDHGDGVKLLDDRSANGTFVNGERVAEASLHDRDVVAIGRVVLVYIEIADAPGDTP
jgi:pSer/pThr/pTyr-binding forkhead associated (FHA) protein